MSTNFYHAFDVKNNTLYLTGEVCEAMSMTVSKFITLMARAQETKGYSPTIVLNTPGGDFYQALGIYDTIRYSEMEVKIVCSSCVMSAGMIILQAAHTRVSYENTQFMIHYGEDGNVSPDSAKHNAKMFELMKTIIGHRVNVKPRTLNSWFKSDTYFTAREAISKGLIDRIAGEG